MTDAVYLLSSYLTVYMIHAASYGGIRYGYYHTLLTSAVSHYSMGHIFSNMFTFYFFGSNLCQIIGGARVRPAGVVWT